MSDGPAYALRAAVRSLQEVIEPALADCANPLAREQARLVGQYLDFLSQRWDDVPDLAAFELHHRMRLAASVLELMDDADDRADDLRRALVDARTEDDAGNASSSAGNLARKRLLTALSALIRDLGQEHSRRRELVEETVTAFEKELIGVRRSWFLPQGWEPDPSAIPQFDLDKLTHRRDS